jgi:hypothetical protein
MSILSKTLYIFLLVFTFIGLGNIVFAQTTLPPTAPSSTTTTSGCQEVPLPNLPGIEDPCSSPAAYIQYWFYFSLYLAGIVALLAFVVGGTLYMFSGASSSSAATGKKWMINAILGLILLFGSFLLLRALGGPGLIILRDPALPQLPSVGVIEVIESSDREAGQSCSNDSNCQAVGLVCAGNKCKVAAGCASVDCSGDASACPSTTATDSRGNTLSCCKVTGSQCTYNDAPVQSPEPGLCSGSDALCQSGLRCITNPSGSSQCFDGSEDDPCEGQGEQGTCQAGLICTDTFNPLVDFCLPS